MCWYFTYGVAVLSPIQGHYNAFTAVYPSSKLMYGSPHS